MLFGKGIVMTDNTFSVTLKVEEEHLACSMGSGSLMVLATPEVVALMENAASQLADKIINDDELTTVGTSISINHISPTPLGAEITATATLNKVDGRMYSFDVVAKDEKGEIANGSHTRVVVNAIKFQTKADEKFYE